MGRVSNDIIFYSILCNLFFTLLVGYLYEIFGRKQTIFWSTILVAISILLVPYCAPYVYPWLIILRVGFGLFLTAPQCNPLASDYVKRSSRGQAAALTNMGVVLGEFMTFACFMNLSKYIDAEMSFSITASIIAFFGLLFLFIVKEPVMNRRRPPMGPKASSRKMLLLAAKSTFANIPSRSSKFKRLTQSVWKACRSNIALPISFIGVAINKCAVIIQNTFLLLWITSFVDKGYLRSTN